MKLFGAEVKKTSTNSNYNILQVENFSEIFFDVYEIELNNGKFPVEKISEYKGNPVVAVPIIVEGNEEIHSFVLTKGKQSIILSEKSIPISVEIHNTETTPLVENFIPNSSDQIEEENPFIFEEKINELKESKKEILEQIKLAKVEAEIHASKIKKQKLLEAKKQIKTKEKALNKMVESARENLVNEFVNISKKIKNEIIDENDSRFLEIRKTIDNKINDIKTDFENSLKEDFDSYSKEFDKHIKNLIKESYNSLQPIIERDISNIALEIVERVDSIEKDLNNKISNFVDNTIIENVETQIDSIVKGNVELHDTIKKGVNKALSRVGNVDKKIDELTIALSEEVDNKITSAEQNIENFYLNKIKELENRTIDINESTRTYLIELFNQSRSNLISEIRQIKNEKPIEYIIESKGKPQKKDYNSILNDFDKKIHDKFENYKVDLRKYINLYASGGGTNVVQYADGGVMNGNLTINGNLSSTGIYADGGTINGNLTVTNNISSNGICANYSDLDEIRTNRVSFNTTTSLPISAGQLTWDDADGTLSLGLKGGNVSLQLGQEQIIRVVNKTDVNLLESQYKVVRVRSRAEGGAQGQRLTVVLAKGDIEIDSATTLGVVTENITKNEEGFITTFGVVRGIDTTGTLQGETWEDGDMLYLSPTVLGGLTKVKPIAPQHTVIVGYVIYKHQTQGKIFVKIDNGYELDELHNVRITNPQNNDILIYNTLSSVWVNQPVPNPDLTQYLKLSGGTINGNLTVNGTLSTTLLEALSANISIIDIKQYELSGFNVQGNATVQGSISASGPIYSNGNQLAAVVDPVRTTLSGNGSLSTFAISGANNLVNPSALIVAIDGALQEPVVDYTLSGGQITFTSPLPSGSKAVVISPTNTLQVSQMIPADGSVSSAKLDTNIAIAGQLTAPNQTASNGNSVMTRSLIGLETLENLPIVLSWNTPTGTANTISSSAGIGLSLGLFGSAVAGNYRETNCLYNSPMTRNDSGANNPFLSSRFSVIIESLINGIASASNEIRFLFGVNISVQSLSAAGLALVIKSDTSAVLQIHNGSTLEESASITIPDFKTPSKLMVTWNGSVWSLWSSSNNNGVFPRLSKLADFSHSGVIPSTCGGTNWKIVNIATGTASFQHTLYLRAAHYLPYALT